MLVKNTFIYRQLATFIDAALNLGAASVNVVVTGAAASVTQCVRTCGSECEDRCEPLTNALTHSVRSYAPDNLGQGIQSIPFYQMLASVFRLSYQLPYTGWMEYGQDVLLPLALIPLHAGAQLSEDRVGRETRQVLEVTAASVAYASLSSSVNPTEFPDQTCYLLKAGANGLFMISGRPLEMAASVAGKTAVGLLCNQCESTVNEMVPFVVVLTPAIIMEAQGLKIPVLNIWPKFLLGGALIAGDTITAVQDGHLETPVVLMIVLSTNLHGGNAAKALGWGLVLLFGPAKYYLGDSTRNAWNSMFGGSE